jgi:hypothetical protein
VPLSETESHRFFFSLVETLEALCSVRGRLAEVEGGGDEFHHGLLLEAEGGRAGIAFGIEGATVFAGQGETPAVACHVDVRLL